MLQEYVGDSVLALSPIDFFQLPVVHSASTATVADQKHFIKLGLSELVIDLQRLHDFIANPELCLVDT